MTSNQTPRKTPPKRVVSLQRNQALGATPAPPVPEAHSRPSWRPVAGTVQLFLGLILMVISSQTVLLNDDPVVFLSGLVLAGSCIAWFGVLDRRPRRHWH